MTWNAWQDGHGPGLKCLTKDENMKLDDSLKIMNCKHAGSCTATTQACDVGPQFKCLKSFNKTTTFKNLPGVGLKFNFTEKLKELSVTGELFLKATTKKALIDHVVSAPDTLTRSMHVKNLLKGFQENGMCDLLTGHYPDLHKIIKTCKRVLTKEEEDLIISTFPVLYKKMMEEGHIPEELFDVSFVSTHTIMFTATRVPPWLPRHGWPTYAPYGASGAYNEPCAAGVPGPQFAQPSALPPMAIV